MQTFLPYPNFYDSLQTLDTRRLGKQRVEAFQIIRTLKGESTGWQNHPALRMWVGHLDHLIHYYNCSLDVWEQRGYMNSKLQPMITAFSVVDPPFWLGDEKFHASHRSNLLRKAPEHYGQFGWTEPPDLPYVWPV